MAPSGSAIANHVDPIRYASPISIPRPAAVRATPHHTGRPTDDAGRDIASSSPPWKMSTVAHAEQPRELERRHSTGGRWRLQGGIDGGSQCAPSPSFGAPRAHQGAVYGRQRVRSTCWSMSPLNVGQWPGPSWQPRPGPARICSVLPGPPTAIIMRWAPEVQRQGYRAAAGSSRPCAAGDAGADAAAGDAGAAGGNHAERTDGRTFTVDPRLSTSPDRLTTVHSLVGWFRQLIRLPAACDLAMPACDGGACSVVISRFWLSDYPVCRSVWRARTAPPWSFSEVTRTQVRHQEGSAAATHRTFMSAARILQRTIVNVCFCRFPSPPFHTIYSMMIVWMLVDWGLMASSVQVGYIMPR